MRFENMIKKSYVLLVTLVFGIIPGLILKFFGKIRMPTRKKEAV